MVETGIKEYISCSLLLAYFNATFNNNILLNWKIGVTWDFSGQSHSFKYFKIQLGFTCLLLNCLPNVKQALESENSFLGTWK